MNKAPAKTALMIHAVGNDSVQLKREAANLGNQLQLDNDTVLHVAPQSFHVGVALAPDVSAMAAIYHRQTAAARQ